MDEAEVVASISAGDHAGLAEALDRYSASLFSFCRTMLPAAEAADVVENTFVIARVKIDGLRDPGKLEAWLQAVARGECFRCLAAKGELPPAFISEGPGEPVPAGLRGKILKVCTDDTATARAHRTSVAHRAGPFGHDGFPKPAVTPKITRFGRGTKAGAAAAVAVLAIAVSAAALLTSGSHPSRTVAAGQEEGLAAGGSATSSAAATTAVPPSQPGHRPTADASLRVARLTSSASSTGLATAPATGPATAPVIVTVPGPKPGSPSPAPGAPSPAPRTSSASTPPSQGTLQLSVAVISMLSVKNRPVTTAITLTAVGGPIADYSVTISGAAPGNVIVSPRYGSIAAGQQVVVTVMAHGRRSFTAYLTFSPGGQVVVIHVKARR